MNFLAHLYLSGNDDEVKLGNFMGDAVKGNKYKNYPSRIQKGIIMHRAIDSFTDNHEITKEIKKYFAPHYGKYAGIVVDIFYDFFLANNWSLYTTEDFNQYVAYVYSLLMNNFRLLPLRLKKFIPFFIARNRLGGYKNINEIAKVLNIMSKYTSLPSETDHAIRILKLNQSELELKFIFFFDDLRKYIREEYNRF